MTPELAGYWEDIRRELYAVQGQRNTLLEDVVRLTRERDEALVDARRYRWVRHRNPDAVATIAWGCKAACRYPDPDRAIDAAMKALEGRDAVA